MKIASVIAVSAVLLGSISSASAFDGWHVVKATPVNGIGSAWDYLTYDATQHYLFIGHRKAGLEVFDTQKQKIIKTIDKTPEASSNGALIIPEFDLGISSNEDGTIIPFSLSTLAAQAPIKLGSGLDTSHYEPVTKRIFVNMESDANGVDIIVLEAPSLKKVGAVHLPTKKPEHADVDGKGNIYIAARDLNKVFRIDAKTLAVTGDWPTTGCAQTNSLALDTENQRIMLGCRGSKDLKPSFTVMDMNNGKVVYNAEIGGGNDDVIYDSDLKRIFLSNGVNAVLNVFEQTDANTYKPLEALGTRAAIRTMAYDRSMKKIYTFTGEGSANYAKPVVTSVSPFYANTYWPDSFVVLTIAAEKS